MVDSPAVEKWNLWPLGKSMLVLVSIRKWVHSQLSNGLREGGKGPSVWSAFPQCPGSIPHCTCTYSCQSPHHIVCKTVCEWSTSPSKMSTPRLPSNISHLLHAEDVPAIVLGSLSELTLQVFSVTLWDRCVSHPHFSNERTRMQRHFFIHQQAELTGLSIYRFLEVCLSSVALDLIFITTTLWNYIVYIIV